MISAERFWKIIDNSLEVINSVTGYPVVVYDNKGFIIRATDKSRIGDLHLGTAKIMRGEVTNYIVTKDEAATNPLVREGYNFPVIVDGNIVAGIGIAGKLAEVIPMAKIATKTIESWIREQTFYEQLIRSEKNYRNIFYHSPYGLYQVDKSGRILTVNPAFSKMLGYHEPQDLITAIGNITNLYKDRKDRLRLVDMLEDKGHLYDFVTKFVCKNGSFIDVKISATTVLDPEESTPQIEGVVEDITEKLKADEALRLSEEKYSKAFSNCPLSVVVSSLETGKYIEVNETFLSVLGYQRAEVVGRSSLKLNIWVNPEERTQIIETIKAKGRVAEVEITRRTKDGSILFVLFWGEIINVANEECLLSVTLDITERKNIEQQNAELERNWAHAQKLNALGEIAGGISHDFNNILTGIIGSSELLSFCISDHPEAQKYNSMIRKTADRATGLTKKLLTFSQKDPISSSQLDVHEIVDTTLDLLKNTIDRRINLKTSKLAQSSFLIGDSSQIQNFLLNLGINSSQSMPTGGTLTYSTKNINLDTIYCDASTFDLKPGAFIEIEVHDTGFGISSEHIGQIFDPFFTTKRLTGGSGLGLSAVYGIVKQHGGAIKVSSKVGIGTNFKILFPVVKKDNVVKENALEVKGNGTILLVDDEPTIRLTTQTTLQYLGYKVIVTANGQEAVEIFKKDPGKFDLIVLDMIMPVMNGRDCFFAIKKIDANIPIIVSSGHFLEKDLKEMRLNGLSDFISKPHCISELARMIDKYI